MSDIRGPSSVDNCVGKWRILSRTAVLELYLTYCKYSSLFMFGCFLYAYHGAARLSLEPVVHQAALLVGGLLSQM